MMRLFVLVVLCASAATAFAPLTKLVAGPKTLPHSRPLMSQLQEDPKDNIAIESKTVGMEAFVPALVALTTSLPVEATTGGAPFPSAIAAYIHYSSLLMIAGCITAERILVKPGMSEDDQDLMTAADVGYGIFGTTLVVSGYYRVVEYGKGWDFYSHEPVFWLKIALVGVMSACSFFPTTKIIQRSIAKRQDGSYPPMSEKLASRMQSVMNAEITALLSIPLSATIMARGIGYNDSIPWPLEAFLAAAVFLGLGFKYIKEALDFDEEDDIPEEA